MATKKIPQLAARSVALTGDEELEIAYNDNSYRLTTEQLFKTVGVLPALSGSGNPLPASGFRIPLYNVSDGQPYSCTLAQALVLQGDVPAGGTTGQALVKASNADYDTTWGAPAAAGSDTQITYNDGGTAAGTSRLEWDKTNYRLDFIRNAGVSSGAGGILFQIPSSEIGNGIAWVDTFSNGTFSNGGVSGTDVYYDPVKTRGWGISGSGILASATKAGIWESIEYQFWNGSTYGAEWHRALLPTGSGAQIAFVVSGGSLASVSSYVAPGTNYNVGQRISVGNSTTVVTVDSVNGSGGITAVSITYPGSDLVDGTNTYTLTPGEIRLDSWFAPINGNAGASYSLTTDIHTWTRYGTSIPQVVFNFTNNQLSIEDSNTIYFTTNNVPALKQINAAGTSAVTLMYLDSADTVIIETPISTPLSGSDSSGPIVESRGSNTASLTVRSAAACGINMTANYGGATKAARVEIDAGGSLVFRNSASGGTTYFDNAAGGVVFRNAAFSTVMTLSDAGVLQLTVANANAFAVGANGATNPVFSVSSSAASVATGVNVVGAAAGSRAVVSVTSSATDEGLSVNAKGSGTIRLGSDSTGNVEFSRSAVPTTDDGSSLGSSLLSWSDLFLASGGVINFNNGTYTLTQSGSTLTASGTIATADLTVTNTPRINQAPATIGTGAKTISNAADSSTNFGHYLELNMNGTTYYVPCSAVAPT